MARATSKATGTPPGQGQDHDVVAQAGQPLGQPAPGVGPVDELHGPILSARRPIEAVRDPPPPRPRP